MACGLALMAAPAVRRPHHLFPTRLWWIASVTVVVSGLLGAGWLQWTYEVERAEAQLVTGGGSQVLLTGASAACRWPGGVPRQLDTATYGLVSLRDPRIEWRRRGPLVQVVPPRCPPWAQGEPLAR